MYLACVLGKGNYLFYLHVSDLARSMTQWVGRLDLNQLVRGSSLRRGTIKMDTTQPFFSTNLISGFLCLGYRFPLPPFPRPARPIAQLDAKPMLSSSIRSNV